MISRWHLQDAQRRDLFGGSRSAGETSSKSRTASRMFSALSPANGVFTQGAVDDGL